MSKKKIVILGAGFGGLRAAMVLEKRLENFDLLNKYEIVLIDKNEYHTYTPLLYEIATVPDEISRKYDLKKFAAYNIPEIIQGRKIRFCKDEVLHVDVPDSLAHLRRGELNFDFLIIALGSEADFFGIPGAPENAFVFKTYDDAVRLRDRIIYNYKEGETKVVVGGGGATGIELAAEIKNWLPKMEVCVLEAASSVLFGFDEKVIKKVSERLKNFGVGIKTNFKIKEVGEKQVVSENGENILFDVFVWTGGVRAMFMAKDLPFKKERGDRIMIGGGLNCIPEGPDLKIYSRIYAIGDVSCLDNFETGKPAPLLARVAILQADVVSRNIISEIRKDEGKVKRAAVYTFQPKKEYPYVVPVGGKFAVAKIGGIVISGFLGWILKGLVELRYLLSIMRPWQAIKIWLAGLRVFMENDNLG